MMPENSFGQLGVLLLAWALISLGTAVVGLYAQPNPFWRGFWFMSGLWGFIDGAIAWFGLIGGDVPDHELAVILKINSGLDVAYLISGLILVTRKTPVLKGFGYAILLQGLFLIVLDVTFWIRISGT